MVFIVSALLVRCIYDIHINLPEKFSFTVNLGNETSHIRCLNENGAYIFSYKEKDYKWIEGSDDMGYTTLFGEIKDNDSIPLRHMASPVSGLSFEKGGI